MLESGSNPTIVKDPSKAPNMGGSVKDPTSKAPAKSGPSDKVKDPKKVAAGKMGEKNNSKKATPNKAKTSKAPDSKSSGVTNSSATKGMPAKPASSSWSAQQTSTPKVGNSYTPVASMGGGAR